MNPLPQEPNQNSSQETNPEIEKLMRENGIEPFDFEAATHDLTEEWTDQDEKAFEDFMEWRRQEREAVREVRKWQS